MRIIGHRGARGLAPENTLAALQKGLEHHVDELEFDVRVAKDHVVVLHHNAKLRDASGQMLSIKDHTYTELKAHKPNLATLQEVLDTLSHSVTLCIEVKPRVPIAPIVEMLNHYLTTEWGTDNFLLGSKSQKTLLGLHSALPQLEKIVIEPWSGVRATWRARQVGTHRLYMNELWLWRGFIRAMAHGGWQLYAYSLNDPIKAQRWKRAGLWGVITDFPDRFEKST